MEETNFIPPLLHSPHFLQNIMEITISMTIWSSKLHFSKSSMELDEVVKSESVHDRSLFALLKSSPSTSSSSSYFSSSYSSSSSWTTENALHSLSPVRTGSNEGEQRHVAAENDAIQGTGMGLINGIVCHGGVMEWKDVEKRFNQVAWTGNDSEPVVAWSAFGFCIGKNKK